MVLPQTLALFGRKAVESNFAQLEADTKASETEASSHKEFEEFMTDAEVDCIEASQAVGKIRTTASPSAKMEVPPCLPRAPD